MSAFGTLVALVEFAFIGLVLYNTSPALFYSLYWCEFGAHLWVVRSLQKAIKGEYITVLKGSEWHGRSCRNTMCTGYLFIHSRGPHPSSCSFSSQGRFVCSCFGSSSLRYPSPILEFDHSSSYCIEPSEVGISSNGDSCSSALHIFALIISISMTIFGIHLLKPPHSVLRRRRGCSIICWLSIVSPWRN